MKTVQEFTNEQLRLSKEIAKLNKSIQRELKSSFVCAEYIREKTSEIKNKSNRLYTLELLKRNFNQ